MSDVAGREPDVFYYLRIQLTANPRTTNSPRRGYEHATTESQDKQERTFTDVTLRSIEDKETTRAAGPRTRLSELGARIVLPSKSLEGVDIFSFLPGIRVPTPPAEAKLGTRSPVNNSEDALQSTVTSISANKVGRLRQCSHDSQSYDQSRSKHRAPYDWRLAALRIDGIDMALPWSGDTVPLAASANPPQKAKVHQGASPSHSPRVTPAFSGYRTHVIDGRGDGIWGVEIGTGVVRLYRESEVYHDNRRALQEAAPMDHDPTILLIPAVPSYMMAGDFLGWVGEETLAIVSHFRMIMTENLNRYMVLMKFRTSESAQKWRDDWDGRMFNGMGLERCSVVSLRSVMFDTGDRTTTIGAGKFLTASPEFPQLNRPNAASLSAAMLDSRPLPPPTAPLIELPTCPVCLERMDSTTTGLTTILCNHSFHCTCLQKWRGSGCPVCRHIQPSPSLNLTRPFGEASITNDFCAICDSTEDLWICLICGHVGCGRYRGGHAKQHWSESSLSDGFGHNFALEIETQHVWDYAADAWVHRLLQSKGDGKLVELPASSGGYRNGDAAAHGRAHGDGPDDDMVPRAKMEGMGLEYTHLLTSQLESQRIYFEDIIAKAADKAALAASAAESSSTLAQELQARLATLTDEVTQLRTDKAGLEKERDRLAGRAERSADLARKMTISFQEEKQVGIGLMRRIEHVGIEKAGLVTEIELLKGTVAELREENRDLGFFISSSERLREVGEAMGEDVSEGTVSLPTIPDGDEGKGKREGKGKGRKKK